MLASDESRYLPALMRALELGGPPGLDRWVCHRLHAWSAEDPAIARRLIVELKSFLLENSRRREKPRTAALTDDTFSHANHHTIPPE